MSENRDEASGQFTAEPPQLFGREEALAKATHIHGEATEVGFVAKRDPVQVEEGYSSEDAGLRQAVDDLALKRSLPDGSLSPLDLIEADQKIALTAQQAGAEIAAARGDINQFVEGASLEQLAAEVDARRAEVVQNDPKVAKELGLDEVPKDPKLTQAEKAEAAEIDAFDGLDPETRKALKIPQVRQAIEQELGKAEQVREQYTSSLQAGQQMLQATLAAFAPQLQGMPLEHWPQAIQMLAEVDPVRANLVADTLNNWGALQNAQQQWQESQAQVNRQRFEAARQQYSRASDAAIGPMTSAEKAAMAEELVSYVAEYGISREQFAREAETNLALHHPAFQRMAADAVRYQRLTKSPAKAAAAKLPPVQKPGTSNAVRSTDGSAKLQTLERQLSTATGNRAIKLAAELLKARRTS